MSKIFEMENLEFLVDYDYSISGCTCHDWPCRCTEIEDAWVDKVNTDRVVEYLYKKHCKGGSSPIDRYCFDRILYSMGVYDKENYEIEKCYGYYGEEIKGVYFLNEEKAYKAFNELVKLKTDLEKIQYCLEMEYGYLIDCVSAATSVYVKEVYTSDVCPAQKEYFRRIDSCIVEEYKNRSLPVAVCVHNGEKYAIVDGYHRFAANKDREKIDIVVLEVGE